MRGWCSLSKVGEGRFGLGKFLTLSVLAILGLLPMGNASASPSNTPPLHFGGRSPLLKATLLTARDIEDIPGAPPNVKVSKVDDASGLYQDPDPRLPCGRKAPNFNTSHAVEEQFSMPDVTAVEAAANLSASEVTRLFDSYTGDIRTGCSYQSKTNTGTTQTTTLVKVIPMPKLTNRELGVVVVVANGGHTFGAYEMAISEGQRVAVLLLVSLAPLTSKFVVALARVTEDRLMGRLAA
jgi:hypothetical protein